MGILDLIYSQIAKDVENLPQLVDQELQYPYLVRRNTLPAHPLHVSGFSCSFSSSAPPQKRETVYKGLWQVAPVPAYSPAFQSGQLRRR